MVKLEYGIVDIVWPFYLFFMVVRPRVLWTYVQRVYARPSLGGKDVRPEGAWTYVHRTFERAWTGMNETCVKSIDSEQFLNGNEWDRGTRLDAAFPWHDTMALSVMDMERMGWHTQATGIIQLLKKEEDMMKEAKPFVICLCTKSWVWRAVWGETFTHGSVRGWGWNFLALLDPVLPI